MLTVLKNVARGCRCSQSSIDSVHQKDPQGAAAAVNCARTSEATFSTEDEEYPWWEVDLGEPTAVDCIVVYNWDRVDVTYAADGRARSRFLQIWGSPDGYRWTLLHDRRQNRTVRDFGGVANGPLYARVEQEGLRFIRLCLDRGILQLNSVQVFARRSSALDPALLDMFLSANERSLTVARRMFEMIGIAASELLEHAQRLDVHLEPSAQWFVATMLMESGRAGEAQPLLDAIFAKPAERVSAPVEVDAPCFDVLDALDASDPHSWITSVPGNTKGVYAWIDKAFRFQSVASGVNPDRRAPVLYDAPPTTPKRLFFCGGCEFSYAGFFLRLRGYEVCNTFMDNRSSDPVAQFLGNPDGGEVVRDFAPDLIVLSMEQPFKQILLRTSHMHRYTQTEQLDDLRDMMSAYDQAIATARKAAPKAKLILLSHIVYSGSMLGLYEQSTFAGMHGDPLTLTELAAMYDNELRVLARKHDALLLDFDDMVGRFGKSSADGQQQILREDDILGGHPELPAARMMANTIDGWAAALFPERPKIKLAVLDLDNTLWDGVYREDGRDFVANGIRSAHVQRALWLGEQGILLALCSKNNPEAADELNAILDDAFPGFTRKVVAARINWLPKSVNIAAMVRELNIGLDTVAFFDDQPFERAEVAAALPEVRVFSDADLLQVVRYAPFLPLAPVSAEGRERAQSYLTEQVRREEASRYDANDYAQFLVSCRFRLTLRRATRADVVRVAEIFQRTNQQNLTLRRTSKELLESVIAAEDRHVWCCELQDKFGDYGMIGAVMVELGPTAAPRVAELAFSCRAMGKGLEKAFLQRVAASYCDSGADKLVLPVSRTDKNGGMVDIVRDAGFIEVGDTSMELPLAGFSDNLTFDRWVNWSDRSAGEQAA